MLHRVTPIHFLHATNQDPPAFGTPLIKGGRGDQCKDYGANISQIGITLSKVFDFIEGNYQDAIGLFEVAQFVGYSPAYLTDLVRRQTGRPVQDWIIERRMTEACRLLQETNHSASYIAEVTGYQTPGYFFRQFRQRYGITPQTWRKTQQTMTIPSECMPSERDRVANA